MASVSKSVKTKTTPIADDTGLNAQLEHQRLESLINSMADGVIATDEKCRIALYNGAALNILDVNRIQRGDSIESLLKLLDQNEESLNAKEIIKNTKTQTISRDYRIKYSDGSLANLYLSISPVHLGYGKSGDRGFVLIVRDITREKSLEEERDEFISVISHELRTPAATIEGSISNAMFIAKKSQDIAQISTALNSAHEQSIYLEDMINDLSTLARAERGVLENTVESLNPHSIAQYLLDNYHKAAEEKGLQLHLDIDPRLELFNSVELYVKEILQNFVTNAIKYTEKGSVIISVNKAEKGVEFSISDTGIGISKGDQEKVFDKFFRSEDYHTRKQNGTGLGLYVTKKLAQMANAKITMKSKLGEGSTFSIYFPNLK